MTRRKSFAFTLIDGAVVAVVLGMIASVSLPAIQLQGETARRTTCRNRLKQLGLAMHEYHDKHKTFPPGIVGQNFGPTDAGKCQFTAASETCDNSSFARASAFTLILPFMEQRGVHRAYNMQLACCAAENATATSVVVNTFVCPSNPRGMKPVALPYYASKAGPGPTDYVLSLGGVGLFTCDNPFIINTSSPSKHGIPGIMKRAAGVFNVNSSISIDKMRDGTSNTIMIGESVGGPELYVGRAGKSLVEGGQQMDSASAKVVCDNPWSMGYIGSGRNGIGQGFGSVFGATAWNAWYDKQGNLADSAGWVSYPVNEGKLKFNRPTWAQSSRPQTNLTGTDGSALPSSLGSVQGFRSYHSGMAQFLLVDGTVRAQVDDTDAKILVGLSSIVGREPIDAGDSRRTNAAPQGGAEMPFTSDARNRCRKHKAISLVETLVVVAIVGILIALILPAMQSVRGHSRRTQCRNNLHLLGLAMHNYHSKHKTFPPGITAEQLGNKWKSAGAFVAASPTCDDPASARSTALTMVLPFLEEHAIHLAYNVQLACCANENATATSCTVRTFVCPANPRNLEQITLPFYLGSTGLGPTDYVLSLGGNGLFDWNNPWTIMDGPGLFGLPGIMIRSAGVFGVNRAANIDKIKDGTSYTILMGESAGGSALFVGLGGNSIVEGAQTMTGSSTTMNCDNPWSMAYIGSKSGVQGFGSVFAATAWNAWYDPQGNLTDPANGVNWFPIPINEGRLKVNRPTWAQASRPTTDVTGTNGKALPSSAGSTQGFRSYHPNMANFLLGDGSVRSFTDHTEAKILVAYSSIVGKEPVDPSE